MSRKGAVEIQVPSVAEPLVLTRALLQQLLAVAARIGVGEVGDEEVSDVSVSKLIAGTLTGDKVMVFDGAGVILKSTNFQKDQRRFVAPLISSLSFALTVPGANFTNADIGRSVTGKGLDVATVIGAIVSADQATLSILPGISGVDVAIYMPTRPAGAGWALYGDGTMEVNAGGIFRGKLELAGFAASDDGTVTIGIGDSKMKALPDGSFSWGSGGAVVGITPSGQLFAGGIDYDSSVFRVGANGNTLLRNTAQSNHQISIGAIVLDILEPTASPAGGAFTTAVDVALLCQTQGVKIYYTVDGSTPDATKTLYTGALIHLTADTTIKAIAIKLGESSTVMSKAFTLAGGTVANPTMDPVGGDYTPTGGTLNVTLSCSLAGASIRYTTDGTNPTSAVGTLISPPDSATIPSAVVALTTGTRTLKAIAYKATKTDSGVVTEVYVITVGGGGTGGGGGGGRGNLP